MTNEFILWIAFSLTSIAGILIYFKYRKAMKKGEELALKVLELSQKHEFFSCWKPYNENIQSMMPDDGQNIILLIWPSRLQKIVQEDRLDVTRAIGSRILYSDYERNQPKMWMTVDSWEKMFVLCQ